MKYEEFLSMVQTELAKSLAPAVQMDLRHVRKNNNVELDGLALYEENSQVAPTIYLDPFYKEYQAGKTMEMIVSNILNIYEGSRIQEQLDLSSFTDYGKVKGKLACKLINLSRNREMLQTVPYEVFLNLAVVAYYKVEHPIMGSGSILVNDEHLRNWKISKETLFQEAKENMRRILPLRFENIGKILELFPQYEVPQDVLPMYVLTNSDSCFGASNLIYEDILEQIAEELQDDFWIIPSSIHECILIPKRTEITPQEILTMIYQVNSENISQEEYLSDDLYCYYRDLHKLSIVETNLIA